MLFETLGHSTVGVFFGDAAHSLSDVQARFQDLKLCGLKQVHGRGCVESTAPSEGSVVADAHWTAQQNLGLLIYTADCLPIFIASPSRVMAIHAGWKSLAQRITDHVLDVFSSDSGPLQAWIGPHIRAHSFEVHQDVANQLKRSAGSITQNEFLKMTRAHADPAKLYFDLSQLARLQLQQVGVTNITVAEGDTKTDLRWNSFRRSGPGAGRNISLICRLTPQT